MNAEDTVARGEAEESAVRARLAGTAGCARPHPRPIQADSLRLRDPATCPDEPGRTSSASSSLPQRWIAGTTCPNARPFAVREYSTLTGGPVATWREMMAPASSARKRADN